MIFLKGYNSIQIVKYYLTTLTVELISDLPTPFPEYNLTKDTRGEEAQVLQNTLNKRSGSSSAILLIKDTEKAVRIFQEIFNLSITGIVNFATWYRISAIFAAISNMLKGIFDDQILKT